ncbi:MAG: hypothetical protein ABR542_10990, partial [Desulfonatronovibrio sp.]
MRNELYKDILLEIALSISGEFDLQKLLKGCIPLFLRKLDCTAAAVLSQQDGEPRLEMLMPRALAANNAFVENLKNSSEMLEKSNPQEWLEKSIENKI